MIENGLPAWPRSCCRRRTPRRRGARSRWRARVRWPPSGWSRSWTGTRRPKLRYFRFRSRKIVFITKVDLIGDGANAISQSKEEISPEVNKTLSAKRKTNFLKVGKIPPDKETWFHENFLGWNFDLNGSFWPISQDLIMTWVVLDIRWFTQKDPN